MNLTRVPRQPISDEQKAIFIAMYLLKKLDLAPADGGIAFPVVPPSELSPLDEHLQDLAVAELIEIDSKKGIYKLTRKGSAYLGELIDEAEALVEEFDEDELADVLDALRERRYDLYRARFLWAWYDGEIDDLVVFQERRGVTPVERLWAFYLTSNEFFIELFREIEGN